MNNNDKLKVLEMQPIAAWPYPRVVACVPQFPAMPYADKVFYQFWAIAQQGVPIISLGYGRTDIVRNKAAMELLRSDFTHLLMLDADHMHPVFITQKLAKWTLMRDDVLVVGGLNFRRGAPYDPCCYVQGGDGLLYPPIDWEHGLIEVDAIGTGSILIDRRVFEMIPPPWFYNDYSEALLDRWPGEDIAFSKLCQQYDIKMWVDTEVTSPHMIDAYVDESSYRDYLSDRSEIKTASVEEVRALTK